MIVRMLKPVDPAQFLSGVQDRCMHRSRPGMPAINPRPGSFVHASNAPHRFAPDLFRSVFCARNHPEFRADKPFTRGPCPAGGVVILEPFWERPAGTQTHSRRTDEKLGRLRDTRQGLVRVSESNTKYGGKEGETGGNAGPVIGPSISESKTIRKQKKDARVWISPRPRCSQADGMNMMSVRLTSTDENIMAGKSDG